MVCSNCDGDNSWIENTNRIQANFFLDTSILNSVFQQPNGSIGRRLKSIALLRRTLNDCVSKKHFNN